MRESRFRVRTATPDDAPAAAAILREGYGPLAGSFPELAAVDPPGFELLLQTGSDFLLAECEGRPAAVVRHTDDGEGIGWFDALAAAIPGAGRVLVRAAGAKAQDRGLRQLRTRIPHDSYPLHDYFLGLGYMPVAREGDLLVVERRLPLLTVREQRREDARAIGELTGEDPWVFEQGQRPGTFVAADGDRVVGYVVGRPDRTGLATIREPVLAPGYSGRGLELWMVERAATHAQTHGAHTVELGFAPATKADARALEDRGWAHDGDSWRRKPNLREENLEEFSDGV